MTTPLDSPQETSPARPKGGKADETRARILDAALAVFQREGFDRATMRQVAAEAGMAVGATYYHFDSKDALVLAFYERAQGEMHGHIVEELDRARSLEARLRAILSTKLEYFAPNRKLLRALTVHTDPEHPLSPFSKENAGIREQDIAHFDRAVRDSKVKLPAALAPYLPRLLWMYQMGLILFWVFDRSPGQRRTEALYDKTLKLLLLALKLAPLPIFRPAHRLAAQLLDVVYADDPGDTPACEP